MESWILTSWVITDWTWKPLKKTYWLSSWSMHQIKEVDFFSEFDFSIELIFTYCFELLAIFISHWSATRAIEQLKLQCLHHWYHLSLAHLHANKSVMFTYRTDTSNIIKSYVLHLFAILILFFPLLVCSLLLWHTVLTVYYQSLNDSRCIVFRLWKYFNRLVCARFFLSLISFEFWCGIHFMCVFLLIHFLFAWFHRLCSFSAVLFRISIVFIGCLSLFMCYYSVNTSFFLFRRINNTIKCVNLIALFEFFSALLRETAGA